MKKLFILPIALLVTMACFGQQKIDKQKLAVLEEGRLLYKSEMASWYGTDIFIAQFKDRTKIGGYLSYPDGEMTKCIFFSKGELPKVIGTITFDTTYTTASARTDLTERELTRNEYDLFSIRAAALKTINSDTLFKQYDDMSLNLIPLISKGEKKVYVLTGPQKQGIVVFGNDYLLNFDKTNKLLNRRQLHKNIIVNKYNDAGQKDTGAMHTHLPETGDIITATDICTLMLYQNFAGWKNYQVLSASYLSIWDCKNNDLIIMTRAAIDKIIEHQKNKPKEQ